MKFDVDSIDFSWRDIEKGIRLPTNLDEKLAEYIGIHIGDGSASIHKNSTRIDYDYKCTGNPVEDKLWYDSFVIPLNKELYNIDIKPNYFSDGTYGIRFRSKAVVLYIRDILRIPIGKKSHIVDIPDYIKEGKKSIKAAFLRGLFDTDFCITFKDKGRGKHDYPVISASFASVKLRNSVLNILKEFDIGFNAYDKEIIDPRFRNIVLSNSIFINGVDNTNLWFKVIGSNNERNVSKFNLWSKLSYYPMNLNLYERLLVLNGPGRI